MTPEIGTVLRVKNLLSFVGQALQNGDMCVVVEHTPTGWRFQAMRTGFTLIQSTWPHINFEEVTDGA